MSSSSSDEAEFTGDAEDEEFDSEEDGDEEEANGGADEDDDDSDDEPLAALKTDDSGRKKRSATKSAPSYNEDDDDDDDDQSEESSDDDVPLSSLATKPTSPAVAKKKKKPAVVKNGTKKAKKSSPTTKKKKKSATATAAVPKKENAVSTTSSSSSSKNYEWASAALYGTSCDKGLLIQRLLCRWWYAYEWPAANSIPTKNPANYDALDGFPGVYICTAGEAVGRIRDTRDAAAAPSFVNFAKKTSEELRDLLVTALEEQKRQLVAAEGAGTATEKELDGLLKWARKVNTGKADKEAATVLKAQGLKLP
jgi:hypothetical protein